MISRCARYFDVRFEFAGDGGSREDAPEEAAPPIGTCGGAISELLSSRTRGALFNRRIIIIGSSVVEAIHKVFRYALPSAAKWASR